MLPLSTHLFSHWSIPLKRTFTKRTSLFILTNEAEGYRGLVQHGGEWHRRVWFCTWWTVHVACPDGPYRLPQSGASQLPPSGNPSYCSCWSITKCTQNTDMMEITHGVPYKCGQSHVHKVSGPYHYEILLVTNSRGQDFFLVAWILHEPAGKSSESAIFGGQAA